MDYILKYLDKAKAVQYLIFSMWALIILSCGSWVLVASVAFFVRRDWLPPDTSGWAQAIGGILAVIVAMAVPLIQNRQQRTQLEKKEHTDRLSSITATLALVEHVRKALVDLSVEMSGFKLQDNRRHIERQGAAHNAIQSAAMLREIPVTTFSTEMVKSIIRLREIANYGEYAGTKLTSFGTMTFDSTGVHTQLNDNLKDLLALESYLRLLLKDAEANVELQTARCSASITR